MGGGGGLTATMKISQSKLVKNTTIDLVAVAQLCAFFENPSGSLEQGHQMTVLGKNIIGSKAGDNFRISNTQVHNQTEFRDITVYIQLRENVQP